MKKFSLSALLLSLLFAITSCDTGLGEVVDIEPPEVSVSRMVCKYLDKDNNEKTAESTTFASTIYTKKKVTFYGSASDNTGVANVHAEVKWDNNSGYSFLKNASLTGSAWTLDIEFETEGACWLKIVAEDKKGNQGAKSTKVITLFVDETAPVGTGWYIDRLVNGIQYNLQSKDYLNGILIEDRELSDPSNKDVAQNVRFYICSSFNDAAGIYNKDEAGNETTIPTTTISIYNEDGNKIAGPLTASSTIEGSSNYSPKFEITSETLSAYTSGKHLFQVRYSSKDIVTVPSPNEVTDKEVEAGWFLWWPESDKPRCSVTGLVSGQTSMNVHVGDAINITVFDDDQLSSTEFIECTLTGKDSTSIVPESPWPWKAGNSEREHSFIIKAPETPQQMTLKIAAKDGTDKAAALSFTDVTVNVQDDFKPTLILTSPENNQIPRVEGNDAKITFSGTTLDKNGCKYLEFVWVPDSVTDVSSEKRALALGLLGKIAGKNGDYAPSSGTVKRTDIDSGEYNDLVVWSAKLGDAEASSGFKQNKFDFTISLLNDFGEEKKNDKYFFARVTREDGNYTDSELKLTGDNIKPEVVPVVPGGNMAVIDKDTPLVIKFKGEKSNGLKMAEYKLWQIEGTEETEIAGTIVDEVFAQTTAISTSKLTEYVDNRVNPKFKYWVKDVLGNENEGFYQFVISDLPSLKSINSSAPSKCKAGDDIYINLSFTKAVEVTSSNESQNIIKIVLDNIKNDSKPSKIFTADYDSGSGSTTLVFKYTVEEGDYTVDNTKGLCVINNKVETPAGSGFVPGPGYTTDVPVEALNELKSKIHLETLKDEDNLQAKRASNPIIIDGISPKITDITVTSDAETGNKVGGVAYLKAGRTVKATVTTGEKVTVQGTPTFKLGNLNLAWESINASGTELVFSKKIEATDENAALSYDEKSCINEASLAVIKDDFGNVLKALSTGSSKASNITIDTNAPVKPVFKNGTDSLAAGKYMTSVTFTIDCEAGSKTEYSEDGGTTWKTYSTAVTVQNSCTLVARTTDTAGNVSEYSNQIDLDINSTFPKFTVECTNSDGNYKVNSELEFKVYFDNKVDIAADSAAKITLSDVAGKTVSAVANITSKNKKDVTEATFTYTTTTTDDFTLKIAKAAVELSGITDKYGFTQGSKTLESDYSRPNLKCDSVVPYVVTMTPQGTKDEQNSLKSYTNANQITLTFNEPVSVVSGKIYLRQTAGWAIPPMLTASEFNTVLAAAKNAAVDTSKTNTLTASEVLYMDGLEDSEILFISLVGAANDRYHGTAQYVGPYKKMSNGIKDNGTPDLEVKYVLDFGVDIWDSTKSTKRNFGKTFTPNWTKNNTNKTYDTYHHKSYAGWVNVLTGSKINEHEITTDSIRYVLEQAGYHQRSMAVNSSYVTVNGNEVTLKFPEGLLGDSDLPLGREWELVIEKGAFMDDTGNKFGYTYNSSNVLESTASDIIQRANSGTADGTWSRKRTTVTNNAYDSVKPLVLIQDGNNASFMSAGVAKPVIRVDRYSYGLGIYQPESIANGVITSKMINSISNNTAANYVSSLDSYLQTGSTAPTAKVGVKIDCETKNATIKYAMNTTSKSSDDVSSTPNNPPHANGSNVTTKASSTTANVPDDSASGNSSGSGSSNGTNRVIFLGGNGDYTKSCKQFIYADATSGSSTSSPAKEGIFQTVVDINHPLHNKYKTPSDDIYTFGAGGQVVNIHGYTTEAITPYPLRDQLVASSYMRQTYQNGADYYWISYETLTDANFSMYVYGQNAYDAFGNYGTFNSLNWGDWAKDYGKFVAGEFTLCTELESYVSTWYNMEWNYTAAGVNQNWGTTKKLKEYMKD